MLCLAGLLMLCLASMQALTSATMPTVQAVDEAHEQEADTAAAIALSNDNELMVQQVM